MEEQLPPPPPKWVTKTSFDTPLDMSFAAVMERKSTQITQLLTNHLENVTNEQYWPELTRVITRLRHCLEIVQSPTSIEIYGEEAILAAMENCVNLTIKLKSDFLTSASCYITTLGYPSDKPQSEYLNPPSFEIEKEPDDFEADQQRDVVHGKLRGSKGEYSHFNEKTFIINMSIIHTKIIEIIQQFDNKVNIEELRTEDIKVSNYII